MALEAKERLLGSTGNTSVAEGSGRTARRTLLASALLVIAITPNPTESAIANGDTRTVVLSNSHTDESGSFTYMVNGAYDPATLDKLNWFLRDWRLNEPTKMDPKLFDILWEVYRQSGSTQPIDVLSGYRSPQTNAMLRRRSRQVAEHSQHMEGRAIDAHFIDVGTGTIRDIAMRMQAGGVGFYPTGMTPWVHIDSGSVRYWPRMNRDALARLFPDGKTVFIPADGQPMPGYEQARAEIEARGGDVVVARSGGGFNLFSWLFGGPRGGGADDAEEGGSEVASAGGAHGKGGAGPVLETATLGGAKGQSAPQPARTEVVAALDSSPQPAEAPDATDATASGPVTLRGDIAQRFLAPLPPRKPQEFLALASADMPPAPLPPSRPPEFAFAPASALAAPAPAPTLAALAPADRSGDLIAALLRRGRLPDAITHGLNGAPPKDALALTETVSAPEPPTRPDDLARAAALTAPLPPIRPATPPGSVMDGVSKAPRAPTPTQPGDKPRDPSASNAPFGGLILDAFNAETPASAPAPGLGDSLRGSAAD